MKPKSRTELVEAALGKRACSLVIKNANVVNLFTGEIYGGDVGIFDGFIAHIEKQAEDGEPRKEEIQGEEIFDAEGKYLIPGLIDSHLHIESTMMTPGRFAEVVIPHGTTTVITDPHEIANVFGVKGVRYMHEASADLPMRQLILAPSCVPSVKGKEVSGASFGPREIKEMLRLERVIGLAEVMDYPGVIGNNPRMVEIIEAVDSQGGFIQGHAPFVTGRDLSAYLCAGPKSDHENKTAAETREKIEMGMYIDARESSASKNLKEVIEGIQGSRYLDSLTLCTDDREPEDILSKGHMNDVVKTAIKHGLHPVDALRCATLHTAREVGLANLGAVAPGYAADLIVTPSIEDISPAAVFFAGKLVAKNGKMTVEINQGKLPLESDNSLNISFFDSEDFIIKAPAKDGTIKTRIIEYRTLDASTTDVISKDLPVKNGCVDISHDSDLKYVAIMNRYEGNDRMGQGIVKNFGIQEGAVGSTVSHDCHNMILVYDTIENAYLVAQEILKMKGGICCARNGQIVSTLPLPVGGLMSRLSCEELSVQAKNMKEALRKLGLTGLENPLLRIGFLALAVIPNVKMTDQGIIDVASQKILPLFYR